jgi:hypothetical protein
MNTKTGTRFLNVDLDIFSTVRLNKIVKAFGESVTVLYCGRRGNLFSAHVETCDSGWRGTPTSLIRQLVALVKALPPAERRLWDQAKSREFNIGIEAASRSKFYEMRLSPRTLREVNSVNGTIIFTVYAPEHVPKAPRNTKDTKGRASNKAL